MAVHALLYRADVPDSRVDRWNIKLIERIVKKSTTPAIAEIYYYQSTQISSWVVPHENVRFHRLRSGEAFPLAERINQTHADYVLVFDNSTYLSAADIWLLMGLVKMQSVVVVNPTRFAARKNENFWVRQLRHARFALHTYLKRPTPAMGIFFAVDKTKMRQTTNFLQKITYADFIRATYKNAPQQIQGQSRSAAKGTQHDFLETVASTVEALQIWKRDKSFPYWFSHRFLLFIVAQLAVYIGVLAFYIAPLYSLPFFLFAIFITPQFFFAHFSWRSPCHALVQGCTRLLLYLIG
ncbi:MAG TPA: hypothetical protein PLY93_11085 [Turneriella sp.]|nr:hypothetical protein [Turneriella sp.]